MEFVKIFVRECVTSESHNEKIYLLLRAGIAHPFYETKRALGSCVAVSNLSSLSLQCHKVYELFNYMCHMNCFRGAHLV